MAQTTRNQVRGVLTRPDAQVVFVDTPGIHKPRTLLGERLNDRAADALGGVDVTVLVVDATAPVGKGDRFVAGLISGRSICVVNKVDAASRRQVLQQLEAAAAVLGLRRVLSGVGPHRRGGRRAGRGDRGVACRRARCCIRPTW